MLFLISLHWHRHPLCLSTRASQLTLSTALLYHSERYTSPALMCVYLLVWVLGFVVKERAKWVPEVLERAAESRQMWHRERTLVTFSQQRPVITAHVIMKRGCFSRNEKNKQGLSRELFWRQHTDTQRYSSELQDRRLFIYDPHSLCLV